MKLKEKKVKSDLVGEATINPIQFKKWVQALRSGKFKQGKNSLQDKNGGYCCLGVACKVIIPERKLAKYTTCKNEKCLVGVSPLSQPSPKWLKLINDDVRLKTDGETNLMKLNDSLDYSFDDIADVLELIYVHGALK